jgi:hypothetical protein
LMSSSWNVNVKPWLDQLHEIFRIAAINSIKANTNEASIYDTINANTEHALKQCDDRDRTSADTTINELRDKNASQEKLLNTLKIENESQARCIEVLTKENSQHRDLIRVRTSIHARGQTKQTIDDMKDKIKQLTEENEQLTANKMYLLESLRQCELANDNLTAEVNRRNDEHHLTLNKYQISTDMVKNCVEKMDTMKKEIDNLTADRNELRLKLEQITAENERMKKVVNSDAAAMVKIDQQTDIIEAEMRKLIKEKDRLLIREKDQLLKNNAKKASRITKLECKLDGLRSDYNQVIDSYIDAMSELEYLRVDSKHRLTKVIIENNIPNIYAMESAADYYRRYKSIILAMDEPPVKYDLFQEIAATVTGYCLTGLASNKYWSGQTCA